MSERSFDLVCFEFDKQMRKGCSRTYPAFVGRDATGHVDLLIVYWDQRVECIALFMNRHSWLIGYLIIITAKF